MSITLSQLAQRYGRAAGGIHGPLQQKLSTMAQVGVGLCKRAIQAYHAVDTGDMLNSTRATASGQYTYLIGPTMPYSIYVARGTSRMAARPFDQMAARQLDAQVKSLGFNASALGI